MLISNSVHEKASGISTLGAIASQLLTGLVHKSYELLLVHQVKASTGNENDPKTILPFNRNTEHCMIRCFRPEEMPS
jgi:hypothetical protein